MMEVPSKNQCISTTDTFLGIIQNFQSNYFAQNVRQALFKTVMKSTLSVKVTMPSHRFSSSDWPMLQILLTYVTDMLKLALYPVKGKTWRADNGTLTHSLILKHV